MTESKSRSCTECGKSHNTGVEKKTEKNTFEPIDKCIDCLMSKCSFNWEKKQIILSEDTENMTPNEMSETLIETQKNILKNCNRDICVKLAH